MQRYVGTKKTEEENKKRHEEFSRLPRSRTDRESPDSGGRGPHSFRSGLYFGREFTYHGVLNCSWRRFGVPGVGARV
jgi:hypothetical protein